MNDPGPNWTIDFQRTLIEAATPQKFLEAFVQGDGKNPKPMSYSELARRAGFKSRSYIREIILGSKTISHKPAYRVANVLVLKGEWRQLFLEMVAGDNDEWYQSAAGKTIDSLRKKLLAGLKSKKTADKRILDIPHMTTIFTALRDKSSLEELAIATDLPQNVLIREVEQLSKYGAINKEAAGGKIYFSRTSDLLNVQSMSGDIMFKEAIRHRLSQVNHLLATNKYTERNETLISTITFSMDEENLADANKKLRDLLEQFTRNHECEEGKTIVNLLTSFYNESVL